jgi:DNA-binding response OmpR family regulator
MAKILLADDSATMQKVVDVVLREEGFDVQSANNGEEALAAMGSFQPDLVLAYIKLPGVDGYELTKRIKASSSAPVVLLAGAFEPVDEVRMQECGAETSLVKPFQTEDLLATIRKFLPEAGKPAAAAAPAEDDIVFDMSGEDEEEAEAEPEVITAGGGGAGTEAGEVEAEAVEAEVVEAEVVEAEVVEAEVVEAEAVEAAPVEAAPVEAAPAAPAAAAPQMEMPSTEDLSALFMKTVEEKVVEALKGADLRDAVITLLEPHMKDTVSDMLMETMPELYQKLLKELVEDSLSMLNRELENIMWETVPELAESLIKKEIEKLRAEG